MWQQRVCYPCKRGEAGGHTLCIGVGRKEGNVLFNDTLNTFYLRLYGVRHMVKDHSDTARGNLLLPDGLLFQISSKGSFIYTHPTDRMLLLLLFAYVFICLFIYYCCYYYYCC